MTSKLIGIRVRLKKGPVGCGAIRGHGEGGIYSGGQDHGEKSGETQQEVVPCDSGNKTSPFFAPKIDLQLDWNCHQVKTY